MPKSRQYHTRINQERITHLEDLLDTIKYDFHQIYVHFYMKHVRFHHVKAIKQVVYIEVRSLKLHMINKDHK